MKKIKFAHKSIHAARLNYEIASLSIATLFLNIPKSSELLESISCCCSDSKLFGGVAILDAAIPNFKRAVYRRNFTTGTGLGSQQSTFMST